MQGLFQILTRSLDFVLYFSNRKALEGFIHDDKIKFTFLQDH